MHFGTPLANVCPIQLGNCLIGIKDLSDIAVRNSAISLVARWHYKNYASLVVVILVGSVLNMYFATAETLMKWKLIVVTMYQGVKFQLDIEGEVMWIQREKRAEGVEFTWQKETLCKNEKEWQ